MMAKKRILSWLVAASLALSLLPAALAAEAATAQPPAALKSVQADAKEALQSKEAAVEAMGRAEEAKSAIEKIAESVTADRETAESAQCEAEEAADRTKEILDNVGSDNDAIVAVNDGYTNGQDAEKVVGGANDAVKTEADKIDSSINLTDENAVSNAVGDKIDSVADRAQEALDAITKAGDRKSVV